MARSYLNETNANTYSNFNATNNFAVDIFPEYQDLTSEEYVLAKELNTLTEKTNKTPTEIDRQNYLVTLLESKIPRSIDYNNMASALINTQKQVKDSIVPYVESKKTEITNLTETKKTEINTVKDNALLTIEQKKANIIDYMDTTTAGAIRADIGVMGESNVTGASLIEKTNNLKSNIDIVSQSVATQLGDYLYDVITSDSEGRPTKVTYKRIDNSLYKEVTCNNPDVNGFYQTIVEKTYNADGITLSQTKTYTLTYNVDGIVLTKRWVIS